MPSPNRLTILASFALFSMLGLSACGTRGSGVLAIEERSLEPFSSIEFGGALDLVVHVGASEQKVVIRGDDNIVPEISTRVSGDKLIVDHRGWMRPELTLELEVWVPSLEGIDASGATNIEVEGLVGERFDLELSGASDASLRGHVDRFDLELSGASDVDARGLEAASVNVDMSGAGSAKVWATRSLDVDVSGAGEVEYWGEPSEVEQNVSGAGSLRKH